MPLVSKPGWIISLANFVTSPLCIPQMTSQCDTCRPLDPFSHVTFVYFVFFPDVLRRFSRHIFRRIFVLNSTLEESLRQTSEERGRAPYRQVRQVNVNYYHPPMEVLSVILFGGVPM